MIVTGTITKKRPDGTEATADWLIDTDKGELVQVGGDAEIVAEDIDLIVGMMNVRPEDLDEGDGER